MSRFEIHGEHYVAAFDAEDLVAALQTSSAYRAPVGAEMTRGGVLVARRTDVIEGTGGLSGWALVAPLDTGAPAKGA